MKTLGKRGRRRGPHRALALPECPEVDRICPGRDGAARDGVEACAPRGLLQAQKDFKK